MAKRNISEQNKSSKNQIQNSSIEGPSKIGREKMKKGRLSRVPIVEVSKKNVLTVWPYMLMSVKTCDFLSIDLEFTGLGERKRLFCKSVEDRYRGAKCAAESKSVLSIGISTFKIKNSNEETKRIKLVSKVFNVFTVSDSEFSSEPGSLEYLARSNFDFRKVFLDGIPYSKNNTAKSDSPVIQLVREIFRSGKPIVVHNGFLDSVFLYGNFYSALPVSSSEFLGTLEELLGEGGVYDCKYLTEYFLKLPASYLGYVFRYCQRENAKEAQANRVYLSVEFDTEFADNDVTSFVNCPLPNKGCVQTNMVDEKDLCVSMANHGFCTKQDQCGKTHDLDEILDFTAAKKEKKRQKNRKRRMSDVDCSLNCETKGAPETNSNIKTINDVITERIPCSLSEGIAGTNRAGFDAFMTGFCVAFGGRMSLKKTGKLPEELKNCLYLSGKTFPLRIQGSNFLEKV